MNETQMITFVEQYSRNTEPVDGQVKVTRIPDNKTVYIEPFGEFGRSIVLREYKVDGKTYWAGFSSRTQTVFVSQA